VAIALPSSTSKHLQKKSEIVSLKKYIKSEQKKINKKPNINIQLGLQGCRKHTWPAKRDEKYGVEFLTMNEL
jgi:hypothetical protein